MKVVYNSCYGGFNLSLKATKMLAELGNSYAKEALTNKNNNSKLVGFYFSGDLITRHDPCLVKVVETLGKEASGKFANLQIEEITSDKYIIDEYDGSETVQTPEDIDWITIE